MTKKPSEVFDIPSLEWRDSVDKDWKKELNSLLWRNSDSSEVRCMKAGLHKDLEEFIQNLLDQEREKCQAEKDIASGL